MVLIIFINIHHYKFRSVCSYIMYMVSVNDLYESFEYCVSVLNVWSITEQCLSKITVVLRLSSPILPLESVLGSNSSKMERRLLHLFQMMVV